MAKTKSFLVRPGGIAGGIILDLYLVATPDALNNRMLYMRVELSWLKFLEFVGLVDEVLS